MDKRDFDFYLRTIIEETAAVRDLDPRELGNFLSDRYDLLERIPYTRTKEAMTDLLDDVRKACQQFADSVLDEISAV